jgi:CheY-like chemotaxis protein
MPAPMTTGERSIRILLADDSADNRALIEAYLRNSRYLVDPADNGEIAIAKFTCGGYDLVLIDVHMPVMDGFTAIRKIREWEHERKLEPTPILALTASALDQGFGQSMEAGCTGYLTKPIEKSTLLEALRQAIAQRAPRDASANAARIVVEADPELEELIPDFLAHKRDDVSTIRAALERCDYAALRAVGHRIKGEGGSFGFEAISRMGAALEGAAKARDARAAGTQLRGLAEYLDRVQVVFRGRSAAGNG